MHIRIVSKANTTEQIQFYNLILSAVSGTLTFLSTIKARLAGG